MRPILAFGMLLLGLSSAAPEPEYASLFGDYLQTKADGAVPSLVEIESSTGRTDRLDIAPRRPPAPFPRMLPAPSSRAATHAGPKFRWVTSATRSTPRRRTTTYRSSSSPI